MLFVLDERRDRKLTLLGLVNECQGQGRLSFSLLNAEAELRTFNLGFPLYFYVRANDGDVCQKLW